MERSVSRRTVVALGSAGAITTLVLPAAAAAATGDGGSAAAMTIESTFTADGAVTVTWTDDGTA